MTYEQAYKDHCYLWKEYGPAYDMTGGYVDQEDLERMLKKPTKSQAKKCLCSQIDYWFETGVDSSDYDSADWHAVHAGIKSSYHGIPERAKKDKKVKELAERHGCELWI